VAKDSTGAISSTLADASVLIFSVNNTNVRFSMGGTPTASTGILIKSSDPPFRFEGYDGGSTNYLFADGGTAQVSISGFKYVGSGSRS
jgi:prepilin-type processing-associated H-X9-DG protein